MHRQHPGRTLGFIAFQAVYDLNRFGCFQLAVKPEYSDPLYTQPVDFSEKCAFMHTKLPGSGHFFPIVSHQGLVDGMLLNCL